MEVVCPLCGKYSGEVASVEGHISAKTDPVHRGALGRDHREEMLPDDVDPAEYASMPGSSSSTDSSTATSGSGSDPSGSGSGDVGGGADDAVAVPTGSDPSGSGSGDVADEVGDAVAVPARSVEEVEIEESDDGDVAKLVVSGAAAYAVYNALKRLQQSRENRRVM